MSGWTDIASFAKSALSTAQKKIDNVLDIRDQQGNLQNVETAENNEDADGKYLP